MLQYTLRRIAPGDVVDVILGGEDAFYSPETEELRREQLGLNRPLITQYFVFMRDVVTLQFGSTRRNRNCIGTGSTGPIANTNMEGDYRVHAPEAPGGRRGRYHPGDDSPGCYCSCHRW